MNSKYTRLVIYSVSHFCVDFACAFLMFAKVSSLAQFATCVILYNFCAFALQMPLGMIVDVKNKNHVVAALGCVLIAVAYPIALAGDAGLMATTILLGIGNALFHLGGGVDTLNSSEKKAAMLGVFVSPGALGLFLGTKYFASSSMLIVTPIVMLLLAVIISLLCRAEINVKFETASTISKLWILPLFLVVVLRSYMGMNQSFVWKGEWIWSWILLLALVLGKCAGGFLFDRFGIAIACGGSLVLSAICYLFCGYGVIGTLAVFFFNMTMPITLWAVMKIMPGAKGFGFGMLTFALFIGYIPKALKLPSILVSEWNYAAIALVSAGLLIPPLMALKKKGEI